MSHSGWSALTGAAPGVVPEVSAAGSGWPRRGPLWRAAGAGRWRARVGDRSHGGHARSRAPVCAGRSDGCASSRGSGVQGPNGTGIAPGVSVSTSFAKVLWSPSYFAASVGYVSESTVRRYIEHQWMRWLMSGLCVSVAADGASACGVGGVCGCASGVVQRGVAGAPGCLVAAEDPDFLRGSIGTVDRDPPGTFGSGSVVILIAAGHVAPAEQGVRWVLPARQMWGEGGLSPVQRQGPVRFGPVAQGW